MKKIYKSYTDKKLTGVCGGIAQVLGVDSTIVRVIWALCTMFFHIGVLIYIILAFLLPYSDSEVVINTKKMYKSVNDRKIYGVCGGIAEYLDIDSSIVRMSLRKSMELMRRRKQPKITARQQPLLINPKQALPIRQPIRTE